MRFVKKEKSPDFFEKEKSDRNFTEKTSWKRFGNPCKQNLTNHIKLEQKGLCVYCECSIELGDIKVHLEHVKPQSKYPKYRWSYDNLVVSCIGFDDKKEKEKQSCGSHTHDGYNEELFLSPIEVVDIKEYFIFAIKSDKKNHIEEGMIIPVQDESKYEKAKHTIECLGLNADHLIRERIAAKKTLISLSNNPDYDLLTILDAYPPFVSFLRSYFLVQAGKVV